ncbi:class I tRNA ligase family protein, partial [Candidatus Saccharibacteria bacterium]|nr:class I tRNA ligase family protein [Candidatus Saccharibacteria bacterium]
MKYIAGKRRRAIEYEKAIADWWRKDHTFEKSVDARDAKNSYVFYDGPPFITGMPHHGTLLSSIVKDAVPRYWTMRGKRVERRWGWDCHGLPAENFVEKQLGITDRREIGTKISLENYIIKARESMVANSETWRSTIDRIGRWVDFDNSYRTMNKDFMESVWWAFKTLYEKGFIYEGRKVLMYDTKFATPVSKAEVTMDNDAYQVVTDPSAYVKFKLKNKDHYLMAWTTTPWTLPANKMLAVSPDLEYGLYQNQYILAVKLAEKLFPDEKPSETFKGSDLAGLEYFDLLDNKKTRKVYTADFVGSE